MKTCGWSVNAVQGDMVTCRYSEGWIGRSRSLGLLASVMILPALQPLVQAVSDACG